MTANAAMRVARAMFLGEGGGLKVVCWPIEWVGLRRQARLVGRACLSLFKMPGSGKVEEFCGLWWCVAACGAQQAFIWAANASWLHRAARVCLAAVSSVALRLALSCDCRLEKERERDMRRGSRAAQAALRRRREPVSLVNALTTFFSRGAQRHWGAFSRGALWLDV